MVLLALLGQTAHVFVVALIGNLDLAFVRPALIRAAFVGPNQQNGLSLGGQTRMPPARRDTAHPSVEQLSEKWRPNSDRVGGRTPLLGASPVLGHRSAAHPNRSLTAVLLCINGFRTEVSRWHPSPHRRLSLETRLDACGPYRLLRHHNDGPPVVRHLSLRRGFIAEVPTDTTFLTPRLPGLPGSTLIQPEVYARALTCLKVRPVSLYTEDPRLRDSMGANVTSKNAPFMISAVLIVVGLCLEITMDISRFFDFIRSDEDQKLRALIKNSYSNVQVVGRGTVLVDPTEVRNSDEFKKAQVLARAIIGN